MKYEIHSTAIFDRWLGFLKDRSVKNRVLARFSRLENGNFGDAKSVSGDLYELRFVFGGGLRIYYTMRAEKIVLLLSGGDKSTQSKDIKKAQIMLDALE